MKRIAVIDIDGTLSIVGKRQGYMEQTPPDWDAFYSDSFNDQPITAVCDFVRMTAKEYDIFFCTSRRESVRRKTQIWLQQHLNMTPQDYTLIMRSNSDSRPDVVSKIESFYETTTAEERANVAFVVEDSKTMAYKWRQFGYRCFQVG